MPLSQQRQTQLTTLAGKLLALTNAQAEVFNDESGPAFRLHKNCAATAPANETQNTNQVVVACSGLYNTEVLYMHTIIENEPSPAYSIGIKPEKYPDRDPNEA